MKHSYLLLSLIGISLVSCKCEFLTVYTDYLSHENLASYHVNTPDPILDNPPIGQRLLVSWSLPNHYLKYKNLHLEITIRLRNREEIVKIVDIRKSSGNFIFKIINNQYFETNGILTYKVDLIGNDCILEEWRHQLWTGLITFDAAAPNPVRLEAIDEDDHDIDHDLNVIEEENNNDVNIKGVLIDRDDEF